MQILNHGGAAAGVQTLLFSATLPSWVRDITKRFLQPGHKTVDLVGTDKMKARAPRALLRCLTQGCVAVACQLSPYARFLFTRSCLKSCDSCQ